MKGDASATPDLEDEARTELGRSIEQGLREALAHARGEMPTMTIHHAPPEQVGDEAGVSTTEEPTGPPPPKRRTPRPPTTHRATGKEVRRANELAALLTERPAVLVTEPGQEVRPLRLGAREELIALLRPNVERRDLQRALFRYTRTIPYQLACLRPGAMRHSLDGTPIERVSEEHRAMARASLGGLRAQQNERRKVAQDTHTETVAAPAEANPGE